jgi:hypothetical protein
MADEPLEVVDASDLTDAEWAEINRIRKAHAEGGWKAFNSALTELESRDFVMCARVYGAFFPYELREGMKDELAERGITADDLRELIRKLESPVRDQ